MTNIETNNNNVVDPDEYYLEAAEKCFAFIVANWPQLKGDLALELAGDLARDVALTLAEFEQDKVN